MKETVYLEYGYAKEAISPELSVVMDGFAAREGKSQEIRDPLYLQVIAMRDGHGTNCLFIIFDLTGLNECLERQMKWLLHETFGMNVESIVFFSTHTHSAPASGVLSGLEISKAYWQMVYQRLLKAVENALGNFRTAGLDVALSHVCLGVNRRVIIDGRMQIGVNPQKPVDETLRILRFRHGAQVVGVWLNASCHPVNLDASNRCISADFPGVVYRELSRKTNPPFAVFTNSAAGDVNPLILENESPEDSLERNGMELFCALQKAMCKPFGVEGRAAELYLKETTVEVPIYMDMEAELKGVLETKIQLCGISKQIFLLALPFEIFVETKEKIIEELSALGVDKDGLFVCSCANAINAYLPTPQAVLEGGYEVERSWFWYGLPGKYTEESESVVIKKCVELVGEYMFGIGR